MKLSDVLNGARHERPKVQRTVTLSNRRQGDRNPRQGPNPNNPTGGPRLEPLKDGTHWTQDASQFDVAGDGAGDYARAHQSEHDERGEPGQANDVAGSTLLLGWGVDESEKLPENIVPGPATEDGRKVKKAPPGRVVSSRIRAGAVTCVAAVGQETARAVLVGLPQKRGVRGDAGEGRDTRMRITLWLPTVADVTYMGDSANNMNTPLPPYPLVLETAAKIYVRWGAGTGVVAFVEEHI